MPEGEKYQFGEFELDSAETVLRRRGEIVPLTPKAVQVLDLLVKRVGRVVSRKELMEKLWRDAYVEESNLTVAISMARKALGQDDNSKFIETVAKRGYRFVAPVSLVGGSPGHMGGFSGLQITRLTHDGYIMDVAISMHARFLAFVLIEAGKQSLWIQELETAERWQLLPPDPA